MRHFFSSWHLTECGDLWASIGFSSLWSLAVWPTSLCYADPTMLSIWLFGFIVIFGRLHDLLFGGYRNYFLLPMVLLVGVSTWSPTDCAFSYRLVCWKLWPTWIELGMHLLWLVTWPVAWEWWWRFHRIGVMTSIWSWALIVGAGWHGRDGIYCRTRAMGSLRWIGG